MKIGRKTSQRIQIISIALFLLISFIAYVWAVTVTPASGGTAISVNTAANGGSGAWTTLVGPTNQETANGETTAGTVILTVPAGFEFNPASPVTVNLISGDFDSNKNINNAAVGEDIAASTWANLTKTSTSIRFTVFDKSQGNIRNTFKWSGIQVRPINGSPLASGNIVLSGSSGTYSSNAGTLTMVAGAMTKLLTVLPGQTITAGSGISGTPSNQTVGVAFNLVQLVATDTFFNPVATYTGAKTISYSGPSGTVDYTTLVSFTGGVSTSSLSTTISSAQTTTITASDGAVSGPASSPFTITSTVNAFNAFESDTAATATSGIIKTKISGTSFELDIVALTSAPAIATGFSGSVKLELVDSTIDNTCTAWPVIQTLPDQIFSATDNGRHHIEGITEANAWKNVRVRITSVASPGIVSCSSDNFAIRPASLVIAVKDLDIQTAGTARILNNTAVPGGIVHKAGQPFTITLSAKNSSSATTSNYSGNPVAVLSSCANTNLSVCPVLVGALSVGAWSASAGVISTSSASYSEVGAFTVTFQDQTFADVDQADSDTKLRYISSAVIDVGRFVPDHFMVTPISLTPRSDLDGCASSFSYMDEPFGISFILTAQNAANGSTVNYAGSLATLDPSNPSHLNFAALDTSLVPATSLLARTSMLSSSGPWVAGVATVSSSLMLLRAAVPDGPYNNLQIGIAPQDADEVTALASAFNLDADANGSNERVNVGSSKLWFGRLTLKNAYGSEMLNLPIPIQAQYWAGQFFQTNLQDNCSLITAGNHVEFGNYQGGINGANMLNPGNLSLGGAFVAGNGILSLLKPSPQATTKGSVDLTIRLDLENKSYLQGNWKTSTYNQNPVVRATFGIYKGGPILYMREVY